MINTSMRQKNHLEVRPAVLIHTNVAFMSVLSIAGETYLLTSIYEASGYMRAFHQKPQGKAEDLLKRQGSWVTNLKTG